MSEERSSWLNGENRSGASTLEKAYGAGLVRDARGFYSFCVGVKDHAALGRTANGGGAPPRCPGGDAGSTASRRHAARGWKASCTTTSNYCDDLQTLRGVALVVAVDAQALGELLGRVLHEARLGQQSRARIC